MHCSRSRLWCQHTIIGVLNRILAACPPECFGGPVQKTAGRMHLRILLLRLLQARLLPSLWHISLPLLNVGRQRRHARYTLCLRTVWKQPGSRASRRWQHPLLLQLRCVPVQSIHGRCKACCSLLAERRRCS